MPKSNRTSARGFYADNGKGRLIKYLLEHIGEEFKPEDIGDEIGSRNVRNDLDSLKPDFKESRFFELRVIGRGNPSYCLYKRNSGDNSKN